MLFHTFLLAIGHNAVRNLMLKKQVSLYYWIVKWLWLLTMFKRCPLTKTPTKQALVAYNIVQNMTINAFLVKVGATIASLIIERMHGVYLADFRKKTQNT